MADKKNLNGNANKVAMSRALGAAFLNHQVEQLEKTVSNNGPGSGNWRDRKNLTNFRPISPNNIKRSSNSSGVKIQQHQRKKGDFVEPIVKGHKESDSKDPEKNYSKPGVFNIVKGYDGGKNDRDSDIIVVDASVLIHALYRIKKWCKDGREEIIIVPLEALNTLDLLKKGTSALAQKARAASRILEAQVGTNPRIRVQRDDAFVLWDNIKFEDRATSDSDVKTCPEWVRRVICCATWEAEHAEEEVQNNFKELSTCSQDLKVVLAVVTSHPNMSPQSLSAKLSDLSVTNEAPLTPVPLPAPSLSHAGRHEARSNGSLVASWASKAKIQLLEVDPALPGRGGGGGGGEDADSERQKRSHGHNLGGGGPGGGRGRRPSGEHHGTKPGLVERPPAVMAMMEMISQPSKVVRVLARGEKLDPDP